MAAIRTKTDGDQSWFLAECTRAACSWTFESARFHYRDAVRQTEELSRTRRPNATTKTTGLTGRITTRRGPN
jgi:hypothetical protein